MYPEQTYGDWFEMGHVTCSSTLQVTIVVTACYSEGSLFRKGRYSEGSNTPTPMVCYSGGPLFRKGRYSEGSNTPTPMVCYSGGPLFRRFDSPKIE